MTCRRFSALLCSLVLAAAVAAQPSLQHPWQGKRVAYFGDSITDPNVQTGPNNNHFWTYLQQWLGITPLVYGVNGRQWDDIPRQTDQLRKEHQDRFDAVIILMGTNDFNSGLPLGTFYNETLEDVYAATGEPKQLVKRKMRSLSLDGTTFCGRINIALSHLRRAYPDKQVVLLTPIHRGYASFGDRNVQPSEVYQNKAGLYLDDYADAVREAGRVWAVPVVDLATQSGMLPQYAEFHRYFKNQDTDQLHPNEEGHRRMACALTYQLLSIPCTF